MRLSIVAGLASVVLLSSCATSSNGFMEEHIAVAPTATVAQLRTAIKLALLGRHWIISGDSVGLVQGKLSQSEGWAAVDINYRQGVITINCISGATESDYSRWIRNLEKDIPVMVDRELARGSE